MPFISDVLETSVVQHEYSDTKFEASFAMLVKDKEQGGRGYKHIRRLRRDGNCFYRAFLFQLFEHYALSLADHKQGNLQQYKENYSALIKIIENSKQDMVREGGYDEIVIEDFYDLFLQNLKKLSELKKDFLAQREDCVKTFEDFVSNHLIKVLCNHEEANYIIMYMRFLAATYLKMNAILYEDFLGCDIATFCVREVE